MRVLLICRKLFLGITTIILLATSPAWSLIGPSHELINVQATNRSSLDSVMKEQLGMPKGITTFFRNSTGTNQARDWLRLGGTLEDEDPFLSYATGRARLLRHFHDPLQPWDRAGYFNRPWLRPFDSSIRWAQRPNQNLEAVGGSFSYLNARQSFRTALMDPDASKREQAYADLFRALGQAMHLIVDASVPEHVRNDPHALGTVQNKLLGQVGNYEYWVLAEHPTPSARDAFIQNYLSTPITLDPALLQIPIPTSEPMAQLPIARLFDSDRYVQTNPDVTVESNIGLAEITNANFLSVHTPFEPYPHPARAHTEKYVGTYSKTGEKRSYYRKRGMGELPGAGLRVDPVAAECVLEDATGFQSPTFHVCQDDDVWRATARLMLPRAVRYAQAVLDYFFRGKLDFQVQASVESVGQLELRIYNNSAETMTGAFALYTEDKQGRRLPVPGASIEGLTLAGTSSTPGSPPPPGPPPLPPPGGFLPTSHMITFAPTPGLTLGGLTLVFMGRLGTEVGAVVGKVKPWEPTLFAVQELAEFTEPPRVYTYLPELIPEDSGWAGEITQSSNPYKQRAKGYFYASGEPEPGKFIKRVWVAGGTGTRLLLNGVAVGQTWTREAGPPLDPATWEVIIDGDWPPPATLAFESTQGTTTYAPLAWWRGASASGRAEIHWGCCGGYWCSPMWGMTRVTNGVAAYILFGEQAEGTWPCSQPYTSSGYVPLTGLGGYSPGTATSSGEEPFNYDACTESGDYTWGGAVVFTWPGSDPSNRTWNESSASVGGGHLTFGPRPDRTRPPIPAVPPPGALPTFIFKRSYRPEELQWYDYLGVTPPQYQLELR
jgi:hypothetical protein